MDLEATDEPHRRYNPLTGDWVLVSPHRSKRPWLGQVDDDEPDYLPSYDAQCPLCPGNLRAGEAVNPRYQGVYVFDNDFAALKDEASPPPPDDKKLFRSEPARGTARVMCYSDDHAKTLPRMDLPQVIDVMSAWRDQCLDLGKRFQWVQLFENKGSMMGCSQPHPHGQIWASDFTPTEIARRDRHQAAYHHEQGTNLLMDYIALEREKQQRVVLETEHWIAITPYWAAWPFETMLLPKVHAPRFTDLSEQQLSDGASALKLLLIRYDNLFSCAFPYSMGWHFAPFDRDQEGNLEAAPHWQTYAIFYPPLLRSATVRKFMVGYEMLAETQRDITPEAAAERLRALPDIHYRNPR